MSLLKWTGKSTRALAAELTRQGHPLSAMTVCRYLWAMEYSLQGDVKSLEGKQHPDRDQQFRYLNRQGKSFQRSGDPVISVDTKKKELRSLSQSGPDLATIRTSPAVLTHDFPSLAQARRFPTAPMMWPRTKPCQRGDYTRYGGVCRGQYPTLCG